MAQKAIWRRRHSGGHELHLLREILFESGGGLKLEMQELPGVVTLRMEWEGDVGEMGWTKTSRKFRVFGRSIISRPATNTKARNKVSTLIGDDLALELDASWTLNVER